MNSKSNRKKPTQSRAQETVRVISEAACLLLNKVGPDDFHTFSTTKVAKKAGVSVGTLYQYFPNKDALLAEVVDYRYKVDLEIGIKAAEASQDRSAEALVRSVVTAIAEQSFRDMKNLYWILSQQAPTIVRPETANKMRENGVDFIRKILNESTDAASIPNVHYAAFFVIQVLLDIRRAMFLTRPEYIDDPVFIKMLADLAAKPLSHPLSHNEEP